MSGRWRLWLSAGAMLLVAAFIYLRVCRPEMELEQSNPVQHNLIYSGGLHASASTRCLILLLAIALFVPIAAIVGGLVNRFRARLRAPR